MRRTCTYIRCSWDWALELLVQAHWRSFANWFGNKPYASLVGYISAAGFTFGAIASYGAGYAYDHFHSYALAFYPCSLCCFLGFVILLFVRPPVRKAHNPVAMATAGK